MRTTGSTASNNELTPTLRRQFFIVGLFLVAADGLYGSWALRWFSWQALIFAGLAILFLLSAGAAFLMFAIATSEGRKAADAVDPM